MRLFCIICFLLLTSCESEESSSNSSNSLPTKGYDAYIFACTTDGESEEACSCQANALARKLSDEQIYILTEAGVAASNGDIEKIDYVMNNHPEIIIEMKNLSLDAEICAAAANTELDNLIK